ncbi:aspartic peptidase domain-containing protein [Xylariaceae sp. FL0662B]|nr:aspartic peptidase domain-containing protein [Xylariaceae sp. FL0662B]
MHRTLFSFLQLLLWVARIHALYQDPNSRGESEKRGSTDDPTVPDTATLPNGFVTFKLVQSSSLKYGSRSPTRTSHEDATLRNRENKFPVMKAVDPTVSNAAGIDQDGSDYTYFVEAGFGSQGKPLYMLVDTGASTTWVMGSGCTSDACAKHNSFGPDDSTTYKDSGKSYSVGYGSGEVSGHVVSDNVSIAGLNVTMPFGVANVTSSQFSQFPFDGILALSMVPDTWLSAVKNAKLINSNVFGVSMARSSDGTNDGEIAFGAPNQAKFVGDVSYTPIGSKNSWAIPMDGISYGDKSAGVKDRLAYIDTGTSFAFGPPDDVKALYDLIPDSSSSDKGQSYTVPCDSDVPVSFSFSGKSWNVSSKDFTSAPNGNGVCLGNVYGMEYVSGAWLLGAMFLKNVYAVFDSDQGQIENNLTMGTGFAAKATPAGGATNSTSQTTSMPTSTPTSPSSPSETPASTSSAAPMPPDAKTHTSSRGQANDTRNHNTSTAAAPPNEEEHGLLAGGASDEDEDDANGVVVHPGEDDGAVKTPRTPNRVRFDLRPTNIPPPANGEHDRPDSPGDYFDVAEPDSPDGRDSTTSRYPLLTDIEAPSVTVANSLDDDDIDEWVERERTRPKSGLSSAFMNMANSIIGAGIIGQPYAFKDAGLLAGIVLLVGLTVVIDWTIRLIVINSKLSGSNSFQGTVEHCFGKSGLVAISVAQWAFAFGGMVAFGVIVGDSIPGVLRAVWPGLKDMPVLGILADRRAVIVIFVLGVSYPLTLYRDIAKLAKASTLALISMGIILVTVVVQGVLTPRDARGSFSLPLLTVNEGIFQAIGVISFAFVCQHNSLLIYGSLKTPTLDRFATVTHYSTGISMLACLIMALAGFLTFGDKTLGNVLNNFPADNTMVTVARLCFGLNMLTTLPLEAFVCREVMLNYYFPNEPFNMSLHLMFSSALVVSAMVLSLITCDLGAVFELVGATSACALAYILPPLCYIKLSSTSWRTYVAMGVVGFGSGSGVYPVSYSE